MTEIGQPGDSAATLPAGTMPAYRDSQSWSQRTHEAERSAKERPNDAEVDAI